MINAPSTFFAKIAALVCLAALVAGAALAQTQATSPFAQSTVQPLSLAASTTSSGSTSLSGALSFLPSDVTNVLGDEWNATLSTWKNTARSTVGRDAEGRVTSFTSEALNESTQQWVNAIRLGFTYNASDQVIEETFDIWDDSTNAWVLYERLELSYDGTDVKEILTYALDFFTGTLALSNRSTFTYSPNEQVELIEYRLSGQWLPDERVTTSLSTDGQPTVVLTEEWDAFNQNWAPAYRDQYTYSTQSDGTDVTTILEDVWSGTNWTDEGRYTQYSLNDQFTKSTQEYWDGDSWVWDTQDLFAYDGTRLTEIISQVYLSSAWKNSDRTRFTYDGTIPVELASFSAERSANAIRLTWITASETNNAGFDVQRRVGETGAFSSLGFIAGRGTTSEKQVYGFTDSRLKNAHGVAEYRLKQIDLDGTSEYSRVVRVDLGLPTRLAFRNLGANPTSKATQLEYSLPTEAYVTLRVYNLLGQQVAVLASTRQAAGTQSVTFDPASLSAGLYFFQLTADGQTITERISVIR